METIFVVNGTTQLVLVPQNELDRILLDKLINNGPIEVVTITQSVGILAKPVKDGIIIKSSKAPADDTNKT